MAARFMLVQYDKFPRNMGIMGIALKYLSGISMGKTITYMRYYVEISNISGDMAGI